LGSLPTSQEELFLEGKTVACADAGEAVLVRASARTRSVPRDTTKGVFGHAGRARFATTRDLASSPGNCAHLFSIGV